MGILAFGDVGPVYGDIIIHQLSFAGKNRKAEEKGEKKKNCFHRLLGDMMEY